MLARVLTRTTALAFRARGFRRETYSAGDWRLRIYRGGRRGGEPWLLLHGLGATAITWLPLARHLSRDCELVLPELSELGGSHGPRAAPTIGEAAELVAGLARTAFDGRRPTVAGISLGGWTAVRAALATPGMAERLLLVVPGGYLEQDWDRIERMVRVASPRDTEEIWHALFARPPWWLRGGRLGMYWSYSSPAVRAVLATVQRSDAFDAGDLARLDLPVGLIWGRQDTLFRVEVGERMAAALPRATLTVIDNAAHAVQWERTREFFAAVDAFRRRFPLPGTTSEAQDRARSASTGI